MKLIQINSQSFWEYWLYWVILFFLVFFFTPAKKVDYSLEGKFISPYILCIYKWRHHMNVVLHTLPTISFINVFPHFVDGKSYTLNILMRSTNKANNSLEVKTGKGKGFNKLFFSTTMRRGGKTWVSNGNTFDWLEIYEAITYFSFSTVIF